MPRRRRCVPEAPARGSPVTCHVQRVNGRGWADPVRLLADSAFAQQREPLAYWYECQIHALVMVHPLVELPQGPGGLMGLADDRGARYGQGVVRRDEAAGADELQQFLEVIEVIRLVGVDEGEIEALAGAPGEQLVQGFQPRLQTQVDLGFHPGL